MFGHERLGWKWIATGDADRKLVMICFLFDEIIQFLSVDVLGVFGVRENSKYLNVIEFFLRKVEDFCHVAPLTCVLVRKGFWFEEIGRFMER